MIRKFRDRFTQFGREEDGQILIEFVLVVPLVFTIFLTSVELGIYQMRQMFLDRGLDMAMREVRLNTGANFTHDDVRVMVCEFAGFIEDCETQLRLEMTPVDIRSYTGLVGAPDCIDTSQTIQPPSFTSGVQNEMMLVRACYMFQPVFATTGLGFQFAENGNGEGRAAMYALSAFVQEPT